MAVFIHTRLGKKERSVPEQGEGGKYAVGGDEKKICGNYTGKKMRGKAEIVRKL